MQATARGNAANAVEQKRLITAMESLLLTIAMELLSTVSAGQ